LRFAGGLGGARVWGEGCYWERATGTCDFVVFELRPRGTIAGLEGDARWDGMCKTKDVGRSSGICMSLEAFTGGFGGLGAAEV